MTFMSSFGILSPLVSCFVSRASCSGFRVPCYRIGVAGQLFRTSCFVFRDTCFVMRVSCLLSLVSCCLLPVWCCVPRVSCCVSSVTCCVFGVTCCVFGVSCSQPSPKLAFLRRVSCFVLPDRCDPLQLEPKGRGARRDLELKAGLGAAGGWCRRGRERGVEQPFGVCATHGSGKGILSRCTAIFSGGFAPGRAFGPTREPPAENRLMRNHPAKLHGFDTRCARCCVKAYLSV